MNNFVQSFCGESRVELENKINRFCIDNQFNPISISVSLRGYSSFTAFVVMEDKND